MRMHARMRRLVWSGDGTTMAGARQNMRVRIPSNIIYRQRVQVVRLYSYNWGEPERAPPEDSQLLRCLYNN